MSMAATEFSAAESALLTRYFTNLDRSVFALRNLPEVVKGALFSRYSRTEKSLRRVLLDEFINEPDSGLAPSSGSLPGTATWWLCAAPRSFTSESLWVTETTPWRSSPAHTSPWSGPRL